MTRNYYETSYEDEPCCVISVAARMVGMHGQSLRNYEQSIEPLEGQTSRS